MRKTEKEEQEEEEKEEEIKKKTKMKERTHAMEINTGDRFCVRSEKKQDEKENEDDKKIKYVCNGNKTRANSDPRLKKKGRGDKKTNNGKRRIYVIEKMLICLLGCWTRGDRRIQGRIKVNAIITFGDGSDAELSRSN